MKHSSAVLYDCNNLSLASEMAIEFFESIAFFRLSLASTTFGERCKFDHFLDGFLGRIL